MGKHQIQTEIIQKKCQTLLLLSEAPSKPTKATSSKLTPNKPSLKPENKPAANGWKLWLIRKTRTLSPFFNRGVMPPHNNPTLTPPKPKENWLKLLLIVWKLVVSRNESLPLIPIRQKIFR